MNTKTFSFGSLYFALTICVMICVPETFSGESESKPASSLILPLSGTNTTAAENEFGFSVPKYVIDCQFESLGTGFTLKGTEIISIRNSSDKPAKRFALKRARGKIEGVEVRLKDERIYMSTNELASASMVVDLSKAVAIGNEVKIHVKFNCGSIGKSPIITDWYPQLKLISTHAAFDVKADPPSGYMLATSGKQDKKTGHYQAEAVRSFGLFLTKDLLSAETNADDVAVRCFYTPKGEACARVVMVSATDIIRFYRQRFGFFPYKSLVIVPGANRPMGGWPIATGIVGIHGMEQFSQESDLHWRWITAHEIGHQYWGEYVTGKEVFDWLRIGLGVYADREYVRARGLSLDKHQKMMERYIEGVRDSLDTTVERKTRATFDFNNVVIHGKGFSIISALACLVGHDTFDRIYRHCLKKFAGRDMATAEFQKVCEDESKQELGWFFDQWLRSNKYLSYEIAARDCSQQGGQYISRIGVKGLGTLKMPVPVKATFEDGTSRVQFTDRSVDTTVLEFKSKTKLKEAQLDPDRELALVVPPPKEIEVVQMSNSEQVVAGAIYVPETDRMDIWLSDPYTGAHLNLTKGKLSKELVVSGPVGSPDGKSIVFYQFSRGTKPKVLVWDLDERKGREVGVSNAYRFSWSPDSSSFCFGTLGQGKYMVYIVNRRTLELKLITSGQIENCFEINPAWSPDGRWIALVMKGNKSTVKLVSVFDQKEQALQQTTGGGGGICWSADSEQMAVVVDGHLCLIGLDGKILKKFGEANEVGGWSPNGRYIACLTREGATRHYFILSLADEKTFPVDISGDCWGGAWSPDSKYLAFWSPVGLTIVGPDGQNPKILEKSMSNMPVSWLKAENAKPGKE